MRKKISRSMVLLITVSFAVVFATFDLLVEAQDPGNQNANSNTQKSKTSPKPRRKRARPTTMATDAPATAAAQTEQTDLSGSYTGDFDCADLGLTGATTLTINGNQFTTADGKTGRIVASTTRGYTAVALQAGESGTPAAPTQVVSLRARKTGDRLTLMPVAGSTSTCSFKPSRTVGTRRRSSRSSQALPAAAGTEATSPAEAGPTPADTTTPRTPARARTRRGNVRPPTGNSTVSPTAAQSPMPSESPAAVPMPSESPLPSAKPSPPQGPGASPAPSPSPTPPLRMT